MEFIDKSSFVFGLLTIPVLAIALAIAFKIYFLITEWFDGQMDLRATVIAEKILKEKFDKMCSEGHELSRFSGRDAHFMCLAKFMLDELKARQEKDEIQKVAQEGKSTTKTRRL